MGYSGETSGGDPLKKIMRMIRKLTTGIYPGRPTLDVPRAEQPEVGRSTRGNSRAINIFLVGLV